MNVQGVKHPWKVKSMLADMNISTEGLKGTADELLWTTEHKGMEDWCEKNVRGLTAKEQAF